MNLWHRTVESSYSICMLCYTLLLRALYMYVATYIVCVACKLGLRDAVAVTGCRYTANIPCALHSFDELCV